MLVSRYPDFVALTHRYQGPEYAARPQSTGLAAPVNDVVVVKDGEVCKAGNVGEIWV